MVEKTELVLRKGPDSGHQSSNEICWNWSSRDGARELLDAMGHGTALSFVLERRIVQVRLLGWSQPRRSVLPIAPSNHSPGSGDWGDWARSRLSLPAISIALGRELRQRDWEACQARCEVFQASERPSISDIACRESIIDLGGVVISGIACSLAHWHRAGQGPETTTARHGRRPFAGLRRPLIRRHQMPLVALLGLPRRCGGLGGPQQCAVVGTRCPALGGNPPQARESRLVTASSRCLCDLRLDQQRRLSRAPQLVGLTCSLITLAPSAQDRLLLR